MAVGITGAAGLDGAARAPRAGRILVVDDEPANVRLLEVLLAHAGYGDVTGTTDSTRALPLYEALRPDLILLDLHMPPPNGLDILEALRERVPADDYLPILVLTADVTNVTKGRALSLGARDYLTKPFDATEVLLRIHNLLETRALHRALQAQNADLETRVRARTRELERARGEVLERLAIAAEYRDYDTGEHTQRVGDTCARLGRAVGLAEGEVDLLRRAAALHDVGKIGIPDRILLKPAALTEEETAVMRTHTTIGARILGGSEVALLQLAECIALTHHERWDGRGYPRGLTRTAIPLVGRIVAVADVYDALTHERPYKRAWSPGEARAELARGASHQFDPDVVAAFMRER